MSMASFAILILYAAASAPIPLYSIYQHSLGISDAVVAVTTATNMVGVMTSLFFAGSLSDVFGRKPVTIAGLACGIMGCIMFCLLNGPVLLLIARFVQGLGNGVAMSAISAYAVDAGGQRYSKFTNVVITAGAYLGMALGSVVSGSVTTFGFDPVIAFACLGVVQVTCVVLVLFGTETNVEKMPLRQAFSKPLYVPPLARRVFPCAALAYIGTWCMGVYYMSFSALIATDIFGDGGTLLGAFILILSMFPNAFGGAIETKLPQEKSILIGVGAFALSCVASCAFLYMGMLIPYLISVALYALAVGAALAAAMRIVLEASEPASRASTISAVNMSAYVGCTIASFAYSATVSFLGITGVMLFATVICVVCSGICFALPTSSK